jgi:hypothetical protein
VLDLILDPANAARDHRWRFPHRLGDRQAEALREALLDDHVRAALAR